MQFISNSVEQTNELGLALSRVLKIPAMIGFVGELGAGKTQLVRAIIEGFGVEESVSSPTYVIEQQYKIDQGCVSHWDLYRLNSSDIFLELAELQLSNEAIVLVEWPSKGARVQEILDLSIKINFSSDCLLYTSPSPRD